VCDRDGLLTHTIKEPAREGLNDAWDTFAAVAFQVFLTQGNDKETAARRAAMAEDDMMQERRDRRG